MMLHKDMRPCCVLQGRGGELTGQCYQLSIIDFNDDYFLVVSPSDTQKNVVGAPNELAFYYSSCIDCYGCSVHIENWRFGVGKW